METIIKERLTEIAADNNLKILYSLESGSRGWQFASPDSDYDVRFIYIKPVNYYLSVANHPDQISFAITDELDIYGWDLRKVLQLIRKSNTTPFEWLQSPIIYEEVPGFRNELWELCQHFFNQRSNIHHYLGIADGALESVVNGNQIGIKKLFYVLRPLLAAKWCLEKESIAPMTIGPLLQLLSKPLINEIEGLIHQKASTGEQVKIEISIELKSFIDSEMKRISEDSKLIDKVQFPVEMLDEFFIKTIRHHDH